MCLKMVDIFKSISGIDLPVSAQVIMLCSNIIDLSVNFFIVLIKYFIYACKQKKNTIPTSLGVTDMFKQTHKTEKLSSTFSSSPAIKRKRWATIEELLL